MSGRRYRGPFSEPFAMLSQTVIRDHSLSAQARLVYAELVLRSFVEAFGRDDVDAAHGELAESLGLGESSVRRYVSELVKAGYVESVRRGRGLPNEYRIRYAETMQNAQIERSRTSESSGENARIERSVPSTKEKRTRAQKPRAADPVYDELVALFGPPTNASLYGKRGREIRAFVDEAFRELDVDVAELVRDAAAALRREWGIARVTVNSLVANFGLALALAGRMKIDAAAAKTTTNVAPDDPEFGAV